MRQESVTFFFLSFHPDIGGREAPLANFLDLQAHRQPQGSDARLNRSGIDAGIDQGGQGHVPADAAETVEMSYPHDWPPVEVERATFYHNNGIGAA